MQRNGVPGSEVSLGEILEHRLLQLGFCKKLFEPGVLLLQLSQPPGLLGLHAAVLLPPAVIRRLRHLDDPADVGHGLALRDQLLGGPLLLFEKASPAQKPFGLELAVDLYS